MREPTEKQLEILKFVEEFTRAEKIAPTVGEIAEHFNIKGPTAFQHLKALQRKGYLSRSSKARSTVLTAPGASPQVSSVLSVPLLGRISAGAPLLSEEHKEGSLQIDYRMLPPGRRKEQYFALTVLGESLVDMGIFDGDYIIARVADSPKNGDIVIALVDNETTVKLFYAHTRLIELRPANKVYESMYYPPENVQIQGIAVGLQRAL